MKKKAAYYGIEEIGAVLTRQQVSAYMRLCLNKVDALPVPRIKVGRSIRFRRCDIDAWLAQEALKAVIL
jgi:hypothetical protein